MNDFKPKILIVDDQDYNIHATCIKLKYGVKISPDYEIVKAYNGHEALDQIIKDVRSQNMTGCSYQLILMDCNMPFMDGYQSTIKIHQYLYDFNITQPIVVAITGNTEQQYM